MRFFAIITNEGLDPFSLAQELDRFLDDHQVQMNEPFLIYQSDPNRGVVDCWGAIHSRHVVHIPDSEFLVRDFASVLVIAEGERPQSRGPIVEDLSSVLECFMKGAPLVTLVCRDCPI